MKLTACVAYEDLYQSPTIVPENVRSLPLVFIVLAMAVRLAPEEWAGDDQTRKLSSLRLYWSCESLPILGGGDVTDGIKRDGVF